MIGCNFVRQFLKTLGPPLCLLLCCSIGAFAQSLSEKRDSAEMAKTISFRDTSTKAAINAVGKQLKLNVIFDDTVKESDRLTLELRDVSLEKALKIVLLVKGLQARIIEENTIIVFPDNAANRERYGQYEFWPANPDKI